MRILIAHSFYRQPGGEDRYVRQQVELLRRHHDVLLLGRQNATIESRPDAAMRMTYSHSEVAGIRRTIRRFRPDVVHVHNVYPSFGPAIHLAASGERIPLLMTVHNFRLRCPNGLMFTEGAPCHRCEGGAYWNAVTHHCFPGRDQAAAYAIALGLHRFGLRTEDMVGRFLAPSRFVLDRLAGWGIDAGRLALVRNFTNDPGPVGPPGDGGLFLGRLAPEKGVDALLDALVLAGDPRFEVAGDGPQQRSLREQAARLGLRGTMFLGRLDPGAVDAAIRRAGYVVVPSVWDENAPLAAMEALAAGRPLVATRAGGLPELAGDGRGLLVDVGDTPGLAGAIGRMVGEPRLRADAGAKAAAFARAELSAESHLASLERVYGEALARRIGRTVSRSRDGVGRARGVPEAGIAPTAGVAPTTRPAGGARPKVLMIHCYYRDLGGENLSFEAEVALLRSRGHTVIEYTRDNRDIGPLTPAGQVRLANRTVWARDTYADVAAIIRRDRPDIVHVQNTFPLLSPSVLHAASRLGVPVVQAVRNYRLMCASGVLYRDGAPCEDCLGLPVALPALVHRCYHDSTARTGVIVAMQSTHRVLDTWTDAVDLFVAPSAFARAKVVEGGLPADRVVVKPNFVDPDPGVAARVGTAAVYAGRMAPEKGIMAMLEAWRLSAPLPLRIIGDGPIRPEAEAFVRRHGLGDTVEFLGSRPQAEVMNAMHDARLVLFPSEWYETFGRAVVEAFACGVPVIAARFGAMEELVVDGETGRLHRPGDPADLAAAVAGVLADETAFEAMRRNARRQFEEHYGAEANYRRLMEIYDEAARVAADRARGHRPV